MKDFKNLTVGICNDHAGVEVKNFIVKKLEEKGVTMRNFGTDTTDSCDYPDFAHPMAMAVEEGICDMGIAICGTGNGISMTCNKHQGIRAALSWEVEIARLAREHNNANVVGIPARFISIEKAWEIVETFLSTDFEGGRHEARVAKIPVR
ncbi:MAG: ribose 5-phosphate isomerase B [Paludibacteraceae bacterium]|jgi:ribose 5-phosphate isomerase B|nr:ribose 5-phosphate isomerase B [Paludibacteraceae bacterium]MEE0912806.1 ribose 5-phosphate isomerase B [Paludibacteraceae bacterium]